MMSEVTAAGYSRVTSTETYPLDALKDVARFLLGESERDRRYVIAAYSFYAQNHPDYPMLAVDLHILMRLLFDMPEDYPCENLEGFRWWLVPGRPGGHRICNLLWPLEDQDGELVLVEVPITSVRHMNMGPPDNELSQYDYYASRFEFRLVDELK